MSVGPTPLATVPVMTDRSGRSPVADEIVAVHQLEPLAAAALAGPVWDYVVGGAGDEMALRRNRTAWADVTAAPRTLVDVSRIDTSLTLLGQDLAHPIVVAPTARHANYHPEGERGTLAGAKAADALYVQSSLGSTPLADVARTAGDLDQPWWFQLYVQRDREFTANLVERATAAGASALVLTVDTPTLGARDRDKRANLALENGVRYPILADAPLLIDSQTPAHRRVYNPLLAPDITWNDLAWLIDTATIPVLVKGVLRADDAQRYVAAGVGGIVVSNHGARNLDTAPATVEVLPEIVTAVAGRIPVLVDGGIRRGTRTSRVPCAWSHRGAGGSPDHLGLAAYGPAGVTHVLDILRTELEMAMALLGAPTLAELTSDLLRDRREP